MLSLSFSNDWSFAIVRAGCSTCKPDPNGVHTVANAWAGGIQHVDIYLFPAFACALSAAQQVQQTIAYMGDIPFGTLVSEGSAAGTRQFLSFSFELCA